ncbi:MAG TPA: hypothetical protein DEQ31_02055 [Exiguobacterium sp.]|nr:hypothetical protein [Exiguobacterium sp.]
MISEKDGNSCGKSGIDKNLQERTRREDLPSVRGKRRLGRKSTNNRSLADKTFISLLSRLFFAPRTNVESKQQRTQQLLAAQINKSIGT